MASDRTVFDIRGPVDGSERWPGHGEHHPFLSFAGLIRHLAQPRTNPSLDEALNSGDGSYRP